MTEKRKDRVAQAATYIAAFDGSLESANEVFQKLTAIRQQIRGELEALQRESDAVEKLGEYIALKRNELAHGGQLALLPTRRPKRFADLASSDSLPRARPIRTLTSQADRVEQTIDAALQLVRMGIDEFGVIQVLAVLDTNGLDLGVAQPTSVIGTILNGDQRFVKLGDGKYRFKGKPS